MNIGYASRLLRETREEWHKPIKSKNLKENVVALRAYERWAFDEIYIFMLSHESGDPILATQELLEMSTDHAANAKMSEIDLMFTVLSDICVEVLDVLRFTEVGSYGY